ncbi:hypothetical protein QUA54_31610 [Microcoleus sp. MOSTC5]|uniref:hypothetical protein n=1 Tax=Microcoleus sp. MOSTC5 TaxID=3055378 RepID=UPI002FD4DCB4
MLLNQHKDIIGGIIGIILLMGFIIGSIIGDVLGLVCLFSNPTLAKTLFGIFLFCPATFIVFVAPLCVFYGTFVYLTGSDRGPEIGKKLIINGIIGIFSAGTFILLIDGIFLKVPFGIHVLFSYCFLLLLLFAPQVYIAWSAIPEEDKKTQFITLLENILPREFHEEWLGDLREQHHLSIKKGKPPWKVGFKTLLTGLGLIRSYLWLESDKFISRWMTRAKKVFLG